MTTQSQLKSAAGHFINLATDQQRQIHQETFQLHQDGLASGDAINEKLDLHSHLDTIQNGLRTLQWNLGPKQVKPASAKQANKLATELQRHLADAYLQQVHGDTTAAYEAFVAWQFVSSSPTAQSNDNAGLSIFRSEPNDAIGVAQRSFDENPGESHGDVEALMNAVDPIPDNVSPIGS